MFVYGWLLPRLRWLCFYQFAHHPSLNNGNDCRWCRYKGKTQSEIETSQAAEKLATQKKEEAERGSLGAKLKGIDIYVIEMSARQGEVRKQAEAMGVPSKVHTVAAATPDNEPHTGKISQMCVAKAAQGGGNPCPCPTNARVVSCTWSHLKALKQACDTKDHGDILLVLEDDANFEPMKYWKEPLVDTLSKLPSSWMVVNGAVSNQNDVSAFETEVFRRNRGAADYGTIAVIYNLAHDSCVHRPPWRSHNASPCPVPALLPPHAIYLSFASNMYR